MKLLSNAKAAYFISTLYSHILDCIHPAKPGSGQPPVFTPTFGVQNARGENVTSGRWLLLYIQFPTSLHPQHTPKSLMCIQLPLHFPQQLFKALTPSSHSQQMNLTFISEKTETICLEPIELLPYTNIVFLHTSLFPHSGLEKIFQF